MIYRIDINRKRAPIYDDIGYRDLAAAVVLMAIDDWNDLCRLCATGKRFAYADKNFIELERFFTTIAPKIVDEDFMNVESCFDHLQAKRRRAMQARAKLEAKGQVMDFGEWIKRERRKRHLSVTRLAELTGFHRKAIEHWEAGTSYPNARSKKAIEEFFRNHDAKW